MSLVTTSSDKIQLKAKALKNSGRYLCEGCRTMCPHWMLNDGAIFGGPRGTKKGLRLAKCPGVYGQWHSMPFYPKRVGEEGWWPHPAGVTQRELGLRQKLLRDLGCLAEDLNEAGVNLFLEGFLFCFFLHTSCMVLWQRALRSRQRHLSSSSLPLTVNVTLKTVTQSKPRLAQVLTGSTSGWLQVLLECLSRYLMSH